MVTFKLTGIITDIFRPDKVSDNFTKRVFWVKESDRERFPQHWELELHNDDGKRLDAFAIGQTVRCEVELRGRFWEKGGKIMLSLKCIGMEALK